MQIKTVRRKPTLGHQRKKNGRWRAEKIHAGPERGHTTPASYTQREAPGLEKGRKGRGKGGGRRHFPGTGVGRKSREGPSA